MKPCWVMFVLCRQSRDSDAVVGCVFVVQAEPTKSRCVGLCLCRAGRADTVTPCGVVFVLCRQSRDSDAMWGCVCVVQAEPTQ